MFNNDYFVAAEVLSLKEKWGIKTVIETGSYLGDTTLWFAQNFENTISIEVNAKFLDVAMEKCKDYPVGFYLGNSLEILPRILHHHNPESAERVLFYLDAHGFGNPCPLPMELKFISTLPVKPIIIIHDFYNPLHPEYSHNTFPDFDITITNTRPYLEKVYGEVFNFWYNDRATGDKVGVYYAEPYE